jgi:DNA-binding MarR family transcriptional regulator
MKTARLAKVRKSPSVVTAFAVPEAGEGKRGEEGYLAYLLRQGAASVRLRLERALADLDVTYPQFLVLTMLDSYPGASGADIARLALLTPQTVHGIVTNLERAALIARAAHPIHGRVQTLTLTSDGRALLLRCKKRAVEIDASLSAELSREDEKVIRRWLVALATRDE